MTANTLDKLFPTPTPLASPLAPRPFASPTPAVMPKVLELLKENHKKYHWTFKLPGLHNHISHHLLSQYALGASPEVIEKGYRKEASYQIPAYKSPETITEKNVFEHIGNSDFYTAYREFFTKVVLEKGPAAAIEEYVFSSKANVTDDGKEGPMALCRILAGLGHPMIYAGYGFEFGLPGMVVEGLAQTYVHQKTSDLPIVPPSLFTGSLQSNSNQDTHALTILSRMMKEKRWDNNDRKGSKAGFYGQNYGDIMREEGSAIYEYVKEWGYDAAREGEAERKMEEVIWMNAIIYIVGGWTKDEEFYNEFFVMHLITSSLFLPSFLPHLNPKSQELLLRGYLNVSLAWYIARGRQLPDIPSFYAHTSHLTSPTTGEDSGNPWLTIFKNATLHYDDHLGKLQRALAHFSSVPHYGGRQAGMADFKATELDGAELLDGSLFLRGAILTMNEMGGEGTGKKKTWWKGNMISPEMSVIMEE